MHIEMKFGRWLRREQQRSPEDELQRLARKLPKRSPLRPLWEEYVSRGTVPTVTLLDALNYIPTSAWREHALGYRLLSLLEMSPSQRKKVSYLLRRPFVKPIEHGGPGLDYFLVMGGVFLISFCLLVWMLPGMGVFSPKEQILICLAAFVGAFVPTITTMPLTVWFTSLLQLRRARVVQRAAAVTLVKAGEPDCTAALSHYVRRTSPVRQEAITALLAILPRMTAHAADRLAVGSDTALLELAAHPHEELALAALDALEHVGPGTAAHTVQRLSLRARSPRVRERAAAILPTLVGRAARVRDASTLLRPSADARAEHLLHPVYESDPDISNLLRASQATGGND